MEGVIRPRAIRREVLLTKPVQVVPCDPDSSNLKLIYLFNFDTTQCFGESIIFEPDSESGTGQLPEEVQITSLPSLK